MRKSIMVFVLVISVAMGVSTSVSRAYAPVIAEGIVESFLATVTTATGATYGNIESAGLVVDQILFNMDDTTGQEMESIIEDWEYDGKITLSQQQYLMFQQLMTQATTNNQVVSSLMSQTAIPVELESGYCVYLNKAGSALPISVASSMIDIVPMYSVNASGIWLNSRVHVYRASYSSTRDQLCVEYFNEQGVFTGNTYFNTSCSKTDPIYCGFLMNSPTGTLQLYGKGSKYSDGSLTYGNTNGAGTNKGVSDMLAYMNQYVLDMARPSITYNVYNPTYDDRNNVVIPVPYNYPIGNIPGTLPQDILQGGSSTPGETGTDYTGILGTIAATLAAVKDWATSWANPDASTWNLDFSGLQVNLFDRFPFCLPFDFMHIVDVFSAVPSDYVFRIQLNAEHLQFDHTVDMSPFMMPIRFFRYVAVVWFVYILVSKTRSLIKW